VQGAHRLPPALAAAQFGFFTYPDNRLYWELTITLLIASIELGIPLAMISWFVFHWLYSAGEIDRAADRKVIKAQLKKVKKAFKNKESKNKNYIYDKWTWFGSGFYGLAGLWTFFVIELQDFFGFIWNFPGIDTMLEAGLANFGIAVLVNQLGNFVTALLWFGYWPTSDQSTILWILIAYLGYWVGVEAARRGVDFPYKEEMEGLSASMEKPRNWLKQFKSRFKGLITNIRRSLR
jgi:hypothetical protein